MKPTEFSSLEDRIYEFRTYMNEIHVGIPYSISTMNGIEAYIIPPKRMHEFNNDNDPNELKVQKGILVPINVDVIDSYKMMKQ